MHEQSIHETQAQNSMDASKTTRRALLKAAAAALTMPYVITSSALGNEERLPVSERITMGFIGIGGQGLGHLAGTPSGVHGAGRLGGFIGNKQVHVLAVCEVDSERRDRAKTTVDQYYGNEDCAAYNDFRELVARDDIDAVCIATPDHWHAIPTIWACKHGKDVYCEKPLTLTVREGRAMVEAARRYNRVVQTGSQQRSSRAFRHACELVRNGRIGRIQTVYVNVGGPPAHNYESPEPVPEGLDWDMWIGPSPWRPYHKKLHPGAFRHQRDFGGGGMCDWGAHHFDIVQWAMGADDAGPVEFYPPDGKEFTTHVCRYANGTVVRREQGPLGDLLQQKNLEQRFKRINILFVGTEGKVAVARWDLDTDPPHLANERLGADDIRLYNSGNHHENFLECVRTRRRPVCDVEIGHRSATVCHLLNISSRVQRPFKWDPVTEQCVGDDEVNRLLFRPKRSPWVL